MNLAMDHVKRLRPGWRSLRFAAALPLAWLIGLLLLWGVYSLPGEIPLQHAQQSAEIFWTEDTQRSWVNGGLPNVQVDNIADAFIIGMAANNLDTGHTPLERALNAYFPQIPGKEYASCTHLACYLSDPEQPMSLFYYGRYWGGFALMARLWLYGCTFPQIRTANLVLQLLVALTAVGCVWRALGWRGGVAVLLAYLALSPYTISLSMQYYPCFYLGFGGMIAVVLLHRAKAGMEAYSWLFLLLGILTAYLDFLTYPSAVVGLPLMIWLALHPCDKRLLVKMLRLGLLWVLGYAGMWAGKWLLCALAGMEFSGGTVAQKMNTYTSNTSLSVPGILAMPFRAISKKRLLLLCLPSVIAAIMGVRSVLRRQGSWNPRAAYFGLIMMIPLAWILFTRGHSTQHPFLSNRNLTVFFAAAFLLCSGLAKTPEHGNGMGNGLEPDAGTSERIAAIK